jgi:hypothetical protein
MGETLSSDVLSYHIFPFIDPSEYLKLSFVSKRLRPLLPKKVDLEYLLNHYYKGIYPTTSDNFISFKGPASGDMKRIRKVFQYIKLYCDKIPIVDEFLHMYGLFGSDLGFVLSFKDIKVKREAYSWMILGGIAKKYSKELFCLDHIRCAGIVKDSDLVADIMNCSHGKLNRINDTIHTAEPNSRPAFRGLLFSLIEHSTDIIVRTVMEISKFDPFCDIGCFDNHPTLLEREIVSKNMELSKMYLWNLR